MVDQAEPPVQPPTADHGADSVHVWRSVSKAMPRGDVGGQAQLHVPHACARKPARPPPPRAEVFAIEAEVARGLARLTAPSGMAEPQRRKLSCAQPVGPAGFFSKSSLGPTVAVYSQDSKKSSNKKPRRVTFTAKGHFFVVCCFFGKLELRRGSQ